MVQIRERKPRAKPKCNCAITWRDVLMVSVAVLIIVNVVMASMWLWHKLGLTL